jgi:two-component system LytT family response regulator
MTNPPLRAWIVDDEPLARERIRSLLQADPEIVVAGESPDGRHAARSLASEQPDLVFLDVQMPEMDGFAVLQSLPPEAWPAIIFVTAYDVHAVRAFEVHAVDYLLKPFDRERFQDALVRAKQRLRTASGASSEHVGVSVEELETRLKEVVTAIRGESLRRIAVNEDGKLILIWSEEIDWIEAAGNYVKLHVGPRTHLHREPLKDFEGKLDANRFLRIHRSIVVNLDRVRTMEPWFQGGWLLVLADGTELHSSRGASDKLRERFMR